MAAIRRFSMNDEQNNLSAVNKNGSETSRRSVKILSPDVVFAFGLNRFNLRLIGIWPDQTSKDSKISFATRYRSLIWSLWVFIFGVVPQSWGMIVYSYVLDELIQIIAAVFGIVGSIVKIYILWTNGEVLAWCLSCLSDDWTRKLSLEERELMMKNAKLGRGISIGFGILMYCLVLSYFALKAFPLFYLDFDATNATDLGQLLLYPSVFPFDLSKRSNFAFAWIGQLIATCSSTIAYTATDCFVAMLVIHLCGQFAILRRTLSTMLDNEKFLDRETFRENLENVVKRHERLIGFSKVIEETVNLMLLYLTIICLILFSLQLFGLMTVCIETVIPFVNDQLTHRIFDSLPTGNFLPDEKSRLLHLATGTTTILAVTEHEPGNFPYLQVLFFVSYLNVTLIHLFLYCYIGDMLIQESEALGIASYSCKWYKLSGKDAKDLMMLMYRARVPLQLTAGKFVAFSLELFGNVLKTSMSYFFVLVTMKEQSAQ